jgi:PAS domain S-box-containing protein
MPVLDDADREALQALARLACRDARADGAWWLAADGGEPLAGTGATDARVGAITFLDARLDGQVQARLALNRPLQPQADALTGLLAAAAALLRARRQAQSVQLEAERRLQAGRVATDWLWETDVDGRVTWMTETIASLTGRPSSDEVGTAPLDHNHVRGDEYAASWEHYLAARAARAPFRELVLDRDTPEGRITVSINGDPRFDADGNFAGYRGATRNITAEVTARSEARRALTLLEQTLEGLPAGVMISGPDDRILMANARWRATIGRDIPADCDTWAGVIRHHALAGRYPEAIGREEAYVAWRLAQASERPTPVELPWRDEWVMSADRRLPDGSIVHLSIYVTERKRAEAALARAEDRWRVALDGAGHGVWDWDADGGSVYFSPSWISMLGHAEHEVGADWREWYRRIHRDDRRRVLAELRQHWRGETAIYETEYRLRHRDGHDLWIHDRGRALRRDVDGRPLRLVGTQSDITRQRQADQVLRDKQAAELVNRSTSEFLSRMSHEMRTPLNAVIGFAELLSLRGEYQADHVAHILSAGRHLLELINDVLDLQQVEQGALALRSVAVDVPALVQAVAALLQPKAEKFGVSQQREDFAEARVQADEQRLRQVLLNLGSNAIKYNRPHGQLCWRLERSDSRRWGLVVEDNGAGLTGAQLKRLFQPFERLGRETSGVEGSGLGLVIARRLVEAMAGELVIHSQPHRGTRVTVWLPRAELQSSTVDAAASVPSVPSPPSGQPTAAADGAASAPGRPRRRVLYVEDNPLNALLFEEALRGRAMLDVRIAADGPQALAIARDWRPDLLVIDRHLPGADGQQVLRQLRRLDGLERTPAVMCSADAMPEDRALALASGFADYWTKPLQITRLADDVEAAFGPR